MKDAPDPTSERELTALGRQALHEVDQATEQQHVQCVDYAHGCPAYVLATAHVPTAETRSITLLTPACFPC